MGKERTPTHEACSPARRQYLPLSSGEQASYPFGRIMEVRAIIRRALEEQNRRRSLDRSIGLLDRAVYLVETRRVIPYPFEDAEGSYGALLKEVR